MARIVKKKLSDSVLDELIRMFESGELKEGEKLPNQNDLAAQLGVSRASLRESLHTLSIMGIIEQRPGFGTVVRSRVPKDLSDYLSLPLISDAKETIELVEARRFIEIGNIELAVQNATEEQIQQMGSLIDEMAAAIRANRPDDYVQKDAAFHHLLAKATGNRFMVHLFLTIRRFMEQFLEESFSALPRMLDRSLADHKRIYQAIKNRDRKKALAEMKDHILNVQQAMESYYETTLKSNDSEKQKIATQR